MKPGTDRTCGSRDVRKQIWTSTIFLLHRPITRPFSKFAAPSPSRSSSNSLSSSSQLLPGLRCYCFVKAGEFFHSLLVCPATVLDCCICSSSRSSDSCCLSSGSCDLAILRLLLSSGSCYPFGSKFGLQLFSFFTAPHHSLLQ